MFKFFRKAPSKTLLKAYEEKLSEAMIAQRNGDMRAFANLSQEADEIYQKIQTLINQ